jgi:pseudaminic acid synthase
VRAGNPMAVKVAEAVNYVAELSANHNSSLKRAHEIIDAIAGSGATSIKFQTYKPSTMTLDLDRPGFAVPKENQLWGGRSLFDLYAEAMTPWEWHGELFDHAREVGLVPFSSPFDRTAVEFLESLDCPTYKIASFEIVDTELIKQCALTGKPMIISTGMATLEETSRAVDAARESGCKDLTLLKTTSAYPASPGSSNLATMSALRDIFGCKVGISDHTLGIGASVAAVTLGASVVEKHVTLDRESGGVDSAFSLEPGEFKSLVHESETARLSVGRVRFGPNEEDKDSLGFRRTIYLTRDVSAGEGLSRENSRAVRPGHGLPVYLYNDFLGMKFARAFSMGEPVSPTMFKD